MVLLKSLRESIVGRRDFAGHEGYSALLPYSNMVMSEPSDYNPMQSHVSQRALQPSVYSTIGNVCARLNPM